jgi:putative oxygen-independent coproporphyrinogen III oxidase
LPAIGRAAGERSDRTGPADPAGIRAAPPIALYVHIPWCVRKCPYCDFNSHHLRGELPAQQYVDALLADLDLDLIDLGGFLPGPLISIFIGGGTPSLLPAPSLKRLLDGIAARVELAPEVEITLEANPGTVERSAFGATREAGVNRVSLGIQSFDDRRLRALGRVHDAAQAVQAAREAVDTFERVNIDLMYALPAQTLAECLDDLQRAIDLGVRHLSHYELTLEPQTVFARYPPSGLPDDDLAFEMREASARRLAASGLYGYEVSAFAASSADRARHNLNYWEFGDYLGIGAGAHGKLTTDQAVHRTAKLRSPMAYLAAAGTAGRLARHDRVSEQDLPAEFMLNALRLCDGFSESLFEQRTGRPIETVRAALTELERDGLLHHSDTTWTPTRLGHRFLNDMQARFLP